MRNINNLDAENLFSSYMKLVGVPELKPEENAEKEFYGKKLGLINGAAWIQLWSYYFGRQFLPGVKLINVGNEAVQLNFMEAHANGENCPPQKNINLFCSYARDLIELVGVDALMITCSTMNRSFPSVQEAVKEYKVPVVQIDRPMMQKAVKNGGKVLIVATHGPTVDNTQMLLEETAAAIGKSNSLSYVGATVESAFRLLGSGKIEEHNRLIADAIINKVSNENISQVVLAQLSMSIFKLSYPEAEEEFGVPVLTSGEEGFKEIRRIFKKTINK